MNIVEHDGEIAVVFAADFVTNPDPGIAASILQACAGEFDLRLFDGICVVVDEGDVFCCSPDGAHALNDAVGESESDRADDGDDAGCDDGDDGSAAFEARAGGDPLDDGLKQVGEENREEDRDGDDGDFLPEQKQPDDDEDDEDIADWLNLPKVERGPSGEFFLSGCCIGRWIWSVFRVLVLVEFFVRHGRSLSKAVGRRWRGDGCSWQ